MRTATQVRGENDLVTAADGQPVRISRVLCHIDTHPQVRCQYHLVAIADGKNKLCLVIDRHIHAVAQVRRVDVAFCRDELQYVLGGGIFFHLHHHVLQHGRQFRELVHAVAQFHVELPVLQPLEEPDGCGVDCLVRRPFRSGQFNLLVYVCSFSHFILVLKFLVQ